MGYDNLIRSHYEDLNNMSTMLRNYIEIYRLLISSTVDLHSTSVIKKSEIIVTNWPITSPTNNNGLLIP